MTLTRARAALVSTLLGATVLGTVTGLALASEQAGWDDCPVGHFCVWEGADGTGRFAYYRRGSSDVVDQGLQSGALSAWNRTGDLWCVYPVPHYFRTYAEVRPYARANIPIRSLKAC